MGDNRFSCSGGNGSAARESYGIEVSRILDACRDRDCFENVRVFLTCAGDELIARTDIAIQIDTFWLFNAGIDPVPYLEAHKDRIRVIHLKDGIVSKDTKGSFADAKNGAEGKSVGSGDAPVKAVREWAIKNNVLMVIESEGLDPTGPEEVKRCIDFLRTLD